MDGRLRWSLAGVMVAVFCSTGTVAQAQTSSLTFNSLKNFELAPAPAGTANTSAAAVQDDDDGGIGVGVLGGWTWPSFRGDDIDDLFDTKSSFMVGGWVGGNRNGLIGFTGEFIYVFRKADTPLGELEFPAVEIPAVFHINFGARDDREGPLGYALVGPVFTLNLQEKLNDVDVDDDEGFRGADIGIMAGGGFEIFRVAFEVRGNWGLRNVNQEGDLVDIKTRAVELVLKFRFN